MQLGKYWNETFRTLFVSELKRCSSVSVASVQSDYNLSQKNVPDIFFCNLKSDDQISIIFDVNVPDTIGHQVVI